MTVNQCEKVHMLFTEEQIKKVLDIDIDYGYDFQDENMVDCFEALNSLPRRDMRQLVQRIFARKSLATTFLN